ncbi:glycosyltransferase family 1 protein [Ignavibacterium sp.]|uniref:glycosyltransferase family 4 protein n=1 Tax=Ignavibacterium sp. TaxID=2651167 RepID=UPI00220F9895|nr:glycosyltransferase family 1 protein [Ignavibacterium sp.]BDQ04196.1 MAG: glycosyl transferase [Ignavibacterium sp.]
MRIGIDARLLGTKIRGTARYLQNVLDFLPQYDDHNEYYIFQYEDIPRNNDFYEYIPIKRSKLPRQIYEHYWLNFILPQIIKERRIDIFFTPYVFVPFKKAGWKNVIVIHDALTKVCSEYYSYHYKKYMDVLVPQSIKRSDAIITVSESAMKDIITYFNTPADKITALHLWTDKRYKPLNIKFEEKRSLLKKYNLPEEYVLFVSVFEERKNISGIIKISDILLEKGMKINFVLVGRKGFGYNKFEKKLLTRKERIFILSEIEDDDLVKIYNMAKAFIFPTFYEGFGLPPLEAMKCGVPVIASNNSSMPEVVGEGGVLGDAQDYNFFADVIIKIFSDEKFHRKMSEKALKHSEKFTAENHLRKLIQIFDNLK